MKPNHSLTREWVIRADEDLLAAEMIFKEKGPIDTLCFLCQQATERYLKAFLVFKGIYFRKVHDLVELGKLGGQAEPKILDFLKDFKTLQGYYIECRYPPGIPVYDWEDAEKCIKIAHEFEDFIKKLLP
jgi:HEPN domain-containing protein